MNRRREIDILTIEGDNKKMLVFHPFNAEPFKIVETYASMEELCYIYGENNIINHIPLITKDKWESYALNAKFENSVYSVSYNVKIFGNIDRKYNLHIWAVKGMNGKVKFKSASNYSHPDYYPHFSVNYPMICYLTDITHLRKKDAEKDSEKF